MINRKLFDIESRLERIPGLFIKAALFVLFLGIYSVTELNSLSSRNLLDYPFGADVPHYMVDIGHAIRHPMTSWLLEVYLDLIAVLGLSGSALAGKFIFALLGAVNILVVHSLCSMLFDRSRSMLYTFFYGLSLSVWYFSSVPESYVLSALLYSLYIRFFVKHCSAPRFRTVMISLGLLTLALLNDISSVFLLLLPFVYYNRKIVTDKMIRSYFLMHIAFLAVCCLAVSFFEWPLVEFYGEMRNDFSVKTFIPNDFTEPLLNMAMFSIGAPSHEVSYAPRALPYYPGFFEPSVGGYMGNAVTGIFLFLYVGFILVALIRVGMVRRLKFIAPLMVFVGVRYLLIICVNPGEAFLFTMVSTLPFLLAMGCLFDTARFRYKGVFESALVVSMAAANLRFFIC